MRRRQFISLLGGATAAWPLGARAQQATKVARIGFLGLAPASLYAPRVEALRAGLRDLGYIEGRNIVIEFRWAEGSDQLPEAAAELVRMNVDIIFASSSVLVEPARRATKTIPIVFATHADPIGTGHAASLARPGGNITGLSMLLTDLTGKQLELFKEVVPHANQIAVLWNPPTPSHEPALKAIETAAGKLGLQLNMMPVRTVEDFEGTFSVMSQKRVEGFIVVASLLAYSQRALLAELAVKHRLPGVYGQKENVEAGGLMSYSADGLDLHRRSASYIDRILKGEKPSELPVQQATKFELAINVKTAKAIGLTISESFLVRADEVIE
jgi:putative ABC transport system substrate-binding protein